MSVHAEVNEGRTIWQLPSSHACRLHVPCEYARKIYSPQQHMVDILIMHEAQNGHRSDLACDQNTSAFTKLDWYGKLTHQVPQNAQTISWLP